jgi:hypothetical protein
MDWRKSSYSRANGGQCLEASSGQGHVMVRDTASRDGATLAITAQAWQAFTAALK